MKRLCAFLLILALAVQCLPIGALAATDTAQEVMEVPYATIEDGSFELSQDNTTSGHISSKGSIRWNGADLSKNWSTLLDQGSANFEIIKDASIAQDGQYCVKITPQEQSRGGIQCRIPASKMVEGAEYVVRAWFKGTGDNDFKNRLQVVYLKSGNPTSSTALTEEWTCLEHRFVYSYEPTRDPMSINLGMNAAGNTGSIYIDNVSIECLTPCESITLNANEVWLGSGQTFQLITTAYPNGLDSKAAYSSSDDTVATVDAAGRITAHKPGKATITVTSFGGATAQCVVTVADKYVPTTGFALNKTSLQVAPGYIEQLEAVFTPADATNRNVTWSSSDDQIVTVDASGTIAALQSGTATITATSGTFSAACTVTVAEDESFPCSTDLLCVDFGIGKTVDLIDILPGDAYTIISQPTNGMVTLDGSSITYTSYTWLMDQKLKFTDQTYGDFAHSQFADTVLVAVKDGEKTATIELKVTIDPLSELFYDEEGTWITDVQLLFSEEKLASIRSQLTNKNSLYYELLQNLIAQLRTRLTSKPVAYVKPDYDSVTYSYDTNSRSNADIATMFMMGYLLTKGVRGYEQLNEQYLKKSIEWLEALLWYPFWGTLGYQNNDLAGGHHLFATAMAYTWLQEELKDRTVDHRIGTDGSSEEAWNNTVKIYEDQPFLEALEMRLWQAGRDMYSRNLTYDIYVMNHLHVRMGGLSAAATALRRQPDLTQEQQEELIRWNAMVLYKDGNAMRFAMPDGTSQEGILYWEYGAEWLIKAGLNSRTALGIDMFEMTKVFQYSDTYLLYNMLPSDHWNKSSSILNIGDSNLNHGNGPSYILRFIAGEYGNQNAQWLAEQVEEAGIDNGSSALWMSLFVADPNVQAAEPILEETLHWFQDMDHIVARSDWSGNEDLLSVKSGIPTGKNLYEMVLNGTYGGDPDAGHAHPDAGHITLFANGEFLLKDDGYADKFTSNHNTLLVNGKGQLGEGSDWLQESKYMKYQAQPRIKLAISTEEYDYIVSDATQAYDPELGLYKYERNILWLKQEQVLLVVDNIQAADGTQLELRWTSDLSQMTEIAGGYQAVGSKNVMEIYPFTQSAATSYETVVFYGENDTYNGKTLRQQYTGSSWQNAIAFSWNDTGLATAEVSYKLAESNVHQFEVGGKIYSIDAANNQVTVIEHTPAEAVKENETAATCTTAGSYEMVVYCSVCNAELSREATTVEALGHTYDDDQDADCNVCGEVREVAPTIPTDAKLKFMAPAGLSFQDYIGMQVMFKNSVAKNYERFWVEITQVDFEGNATTITTTGTPYTSSYTVYEQQILSWSMTEQVTMTLYGEKNGVVYMGQSFTTSVEALALDKIPDYVADGDMARAKALVDMLNFGSAVQTAYDHNPTDLPNAELGELAQYGTTGDPEFTSVNDITGKNTIKVYSNNISMQSKVEFQFMVKTTALEGKTVVAMMGDKEATVAYEPYGTYTIIRVACGAAYMRENFTIVVNDANGNAVTCTYNVSVEAYAGQQLDGAKAPAMLALIRYGDAVAAIG